MSKEVVKAPQSVAEVTKLLDDSVLSVLGNKALQGFEKANQVATAITQLRILLTDEYMQPIMALQGSKLGFKTDRDKPKDNSTPGYTMAVVRDCLIEAVLMGLQPTGNQFNIISGQCYPTKEGCGALLNKFPGLDGAYEIVISLPKVDRANLSAAVDADISWTLNGEKHQMRVPIPIKIDQYASVDSIVGKGTRKARAWLLSRISGVEITDGEVEDANAKVMSSTINVDPDELQFLFENKKESLKPEECADIERILKNKEVKSYAKVKAILEAK